MLQESQRISVGLEVETKEPIDPDFQIIFSEAKIQPEYKKVAIYHGCMKIRDNKVGEFVARIDLQRKVLLIEELFIYPNQRGKGLGKKAVDFLESQASSMRVREVVLEPFPIGSGSLAWEWLRDWYIKRGYVSRRRSIFAPSTNLLVKLMK